MFDFKRLRDRSLDPAEAAKLLTAKNCPPDIRFCTDDSRLDALMQDNSVSCIVLRRPQSKELRAAYAHMAKVIEKQISGNLAPYSLIEGLEDVIVSGRYFPLTVKVPLQEPERKAILADYQAMADLVCRCRLKQPDLVAASFYGYPQYYIDMPHDRPELWHSDFIKGWRFFRTEFGPTILLTERKFAQPWRENAARLSLNPGAPVYHLLPGDIAIFRGDFPHSGPYVPAGSTRFSTMINATPP